MNKKFLAVLILGVVLIGNGFSLIAQAQVQDYTVLAPLPGTTNCENDLSRTDCKTTLEKYLPGLFNLAIGISAAFAVLMIVIGGFQYITTDAIQGKSEGKARILNSIYGLVFVIAAWVILFTINPKLLELNLNIEPLTIAAPKGTLGGEASAGTGEIKRGYALSEEEVRINNAMRAELKDKYGVEVNAGPCITAAQTTGCTNLVGMTPVTFKGVTDLKKFCGESCAVTISGGTEGGHASHGPNLAPIDIRDDAGVDNLEKYIIANKIGEPLQTSKGPLYTSKVGNRNATFLKESNPPHWHVVFE